MVESKLVSFGVGYIVGPRRLLTSTDRGSARFQHVDMVLVFERVDLRGGKSGVGEHSVLWRLLK